MATFQYIAKDAAGNETRGQLEADDRNSAIASVRALGLYPTALGEVKGAAAAPAASGGKKKAAKAAAGGEGGKKKGALNMEINIKMPKWLRGRIKTAVLTQFTRQLATLVNAGLPLMRGIDVLKRQMKDPQMREALDGIGDTIQAGGTFSEALTAYPKIFDNLYINMVKAGEAGGVLEVVLGRLAEFAEKSEKIKNKVKGAMIYPIVVLVAAVGITAFLLVMVIPKFKPAARSCRRSRRWSSTRPNSSSTTDWSSFLPSLRSSSSRKSSAERRRVRTSTTGARSRCPSPVRLCSARLSRA